MSTITSPATAESLRREAHDLRARASDLEFRANAISAASAKELEAKLREAAELMPVDFHAREVLGVAVAPGQADTSDRGDGQQKGYVVLSEAERAKGFVRPVRKSHVHEKCGARTTMGHALAETYARSPAFYSGTFCATCRDHFPVGKHGEFVWDGTEEKVGT